MAVWLLLSYTRTGRCTPGVLASAQLATALRHQQAAAIPSPQPRYWHPDQKQGHHSPEPLATTHTPQPQFRWPEHQGVCNASKRGSAAAATTGLKSEPDDSESSSATCQASWPSLTSLNLPGTSHFKDMSKVGATCQHLAAGKWPELTVLDVSNNALPPSAPLRRPLLGVLYKSATRKLQLIASTQQLACAAQG